MKVTSKIFFFVMALSSVLWAQFDNTPYKIEQKLYLENQYLFEGYLFDKEIPNIITFKAENFGNTHEVKFSSKDYSLIENILLPVDSSSLSNQFSIYDFDKDGLDEIIIPTIFDNRIEFYIYNSGAEIAFSKKPFFRLHGINKKKMGYLFYSYANLDNDAEMEVIIFYCENYPEAGTIRGAFAVDISTGNLLWFYPTASYFFMMPNFEFENSSSISVVIATSGVSNGLSFSNGTFFMIDKSGRSNPYKTYYTQVASTDVDSSAEDYSADDYASIFALDKNGNKVWEKYLGGEYVWSKIAKVDNKKVLFGTYHRSKNDDQNGLIGTIDLINGEVINHKRFSKKARELNFSYRQLFVSYTDNSANGFSLDLQPTFPNDIENSILFDTFKRNDNGYYLSVKTDNLKNYQVVYDKLGNIDAALQSKQMMYYLPKLKLFYVQEKGGAYLFDLVYVPWYKRISNNTFWIILISIAGLVILILALWGMTMHFASKRIKIQKLELERTTAELIEAEKLALLGTIASSLAHELNSPLGAIKNSVQRILKQKLTGDDLDKNLELIHKSVNNSSFLIQKFLNRARKEDKDAVSNIKEVFDEWKELFGIQYELLNIEIIEKIETDSSVIMLPNELSQIINNLFSNSKDSLIESDIENKQIIISAEEEKDYIIIKVSDNGEGFKENIINNALEPFKTTKQEGQGTGLGLWIVKQILDLRNGFIEIKNEDEGSTVKVKIPKHQN